MKLIFLRNIRYTKNKENNRTKGAKQMQSHLHLRAIEKSDIDFVHRLFNDPEIMNYWFAEPYYSKEVLLDNYEKQKTTGKSRTFILHDGLEQLGFIALFDIRHIHRKAEFAIIIDPQQQGKGYAKKATKLALDYALRTLNLNKVYLIVDQANEKAIHIYKEVGFKREATLKDEYFVDGSYRSIAYMSIFQDDYLSK